MNYLITNKHTGTNVLFKYDKNGSCVHYEFQGELTPPEKMQFLFDRFPFNLARLEKWKMLKEVKVTEVKEDISFTTFWNKYAHKQGNKGRAMKLYNALPDPEKMKAIENLRKYNQYLFMNPNVQKLNPETYLNQQRWNN